MQKPLVPFTKEIFSKEKNKNDKQWLKWEKRRIKQNWEYVSNIYSSQFAFVQEKNLKKNLKKKKKPRQHKKSLKLPFTLRIKSQEILFSPKRLKYLQIKLKKNIHTKKKRRYEKKIKYNLPKLQLRYLAYKILDKNFTSLFKLPTKINFLWKYVIEKTLVTVFNLRFSVQLLNLKYFFFKYLNAFGIIQNVQPGSNLKKNQATRSQKNTALKQAIRKQLYLYYFTLNSYFFVETLAFFVAKTRFYKGMLNKIIRIFIALFRYLPHTLKGMQLIVKGRIKKRKKNRALKLNFKNIAKLGEAIQLGKYSPQLEYTFMPIKTKKAGVFGVKYYALF